MLVHNLTHLATQASILSWKFEDKTDEKNFQKSATYNRNSSGIFRRGRILSLSALAFGLALLTPPSQAAEFAYVVNPVENNVWAYRIAKDGSLTTIPGSPFAAGAFPVSAAVDPRGKFLYVANENDSTLSVSASEVFIRRNYFQDISGSVTPSSSAGVAYGNPF